ncbi:hypothetical protein BC827DRAFT_496156 [Russula dissimulans]|nr:hypothetical protein BC827DRAFT_496156 [Russula dissimulans]
MHPRHVPLSPLTSIKCHPTILHRFGLIPLATPTRVSSEANVPGRQNPQRGVGRGIPPPPLPPRPSQDPRGVPPPIPPRPSLDGTTHPHYGVYDGVPGMPEPQRGIGHGRPAQQLPQYGSAGSSYGVHNGGRHFPMPELYGGGIGHGAPAQQPPFDRSHHQDGPPLIAPRPPPRMDPPTQVTGYTMGVGIWRCLSPSDGWGTTHRRCHNPP